LIIWICGPSGAGKTEIGRAVYEHLKPKIPRIFMLDGDEFRAAMGNDLGYTPNERRANGLRMARMSQLLESQDIAVICCGATIHTEVQAFNFANLQEYHQVLLEVSFETLLRRDTKNIYARALQGQMVDVLGVDIKLEPPQTPHLVLNNDQDRDSFDELVCRIMSYIAENRKIVTTEILRQSSNPGEGFTA